MKRGLVRIYHKLYAAFGPQYWWPADGPFEVIVGTILTQNTSWNNVEKAIGVLKRHKLLSPERLNRIKVSRLAGFIRSAGYYNIKARRLKNFLEFFLKEYRGNIKLMKKCPTSALRRKLLAVNGIGNETADSILLYALNRPSFVVDAYTKRIFSRHKLFSKERDYYKVQDYFQKNLPRSTKLFNEFHALIVKLGKDYCLKNNPRCVSCPLKE